MSLLELQKDPAAFRRSLLIDTDQGPRPLGECVEDWQDYDFRAMDPGWKRAAGQTVKGDYLSRAWWERPRGHSKSADVMIMATWCLFASRRQINGVVCAVDRDQAALDRDHVARLVSLNPWLDKLIEVQQWRIRNGHTCSTLEIMASDVASSYGLLIDFAVLDEVTLWPKRDLFDSVLSAAAKRANCLVLCIGNAGFRDFWQWSVRESVRNDERWHFSRVDGPIARWITQANLDEQRRLLPSAAFNRLWLNVWSSGAGDALPEDVIAAAFRPELRPMTTAAQGFDYVAGLDLGVSRDASAVCVLGVRRSHDGHGLIRLAHTKVWRPSKDRKVNLQEVEDALLRLHSLFDFRQLSYDPWEARHMASRLQSAHLGKMVHGADRRHALPMAEVPPTGQNLQRIATAVLEGFNDRRVQLYADPDLRRDLTRLRVEERSYGFRLTSPRDELGHGDLGTAFSLAMLAATELATRPKIVLGTFDSGDGESDYTRFCRRVADAWRRDREDLERTRGNEDQAAFLDAFTRTVRQGR